MEKDKESFEKPTLDPKDKQMFLETWDLKEGELTDEQILLAICLGHL